MFNGIGQEKRATLSAASFTPDPRKALGAAKCLNCGQNFKKKRPWLSISR
jgi:hypothetical protein